MRKYELVVVGGGFAGVAAAIAAARAGVDVLLVDKVSLLQVPGLIGKYKNGRYQEISHVAHYMQSRCVKVSSKVPTAVNMDGETMAAKEVVMEVAKEKLRFFYPRGLNWKTNAECKMQNAEC